MTWPIIEDGTIVTISRDTGVLVPFHEYTRFERVVRWAGRLLHVRPMSRYHERHPVGFVFGGRLVCKGMVRTSGNALQYKD